MPFQEITRPICSEPTFATPHSEVPVPQKLCPTPSSTRPRHSSARLSTSCSSISADSKIHSPLTRLPNSPSTTTFLGPQLSA